MNSRSERGSRESPSYLLALVVFVVTAMTDAASARPYVAAKSASTFGKTSLDPVVASVK